MKTRLGTPQAITATAHQLARLIYMLLKHGTADIRQHMADDERQYHNRMVQNLTRRAKVFGDVLVQIPEGTLASPPRPQSSSLEEQFLGKSPLVKRQRTPVSGLFAVFCRRGLGAVIRW